MRKLFVLLAALPAIVTLAGCDTPAGPVVHDHQVVERGAATAVPPEVDMGAGGLTVRGGASALRPADLEDDVADLRPTVDYQAQGSSGRLKVSQSGTVSGSHKNDWQLGLQDSTPLDLHVNFGAGDAALKIGELSLTGLEV